MGRWTGMAFPPVASNTKWRNWNERRGSARPPGGESMAALQRRVILHLEQFAGQEWNDRHRQPRRADQGRLDVLSGDTA